MRLLSKGKERHCTHGLRILLPKFFPGRLHWSQVIVSVCGVSARSENAQSALSAWQRSTEPP